MQKKELHLVQNFDDLEKLYNVDANVLHKATIPQLLTSMNKLIEKAEKYRLEGDEENSYVLYMRFMNIASKLQSSKDYEKQKLLVSKMLGTNGTMTIYFDRLEKVKKSLVKRFDERSSSALSKLVERKTVANSTANPVEAKVAAIESQDDDEVITCDALFNLMEAQTQLLIFDTRPEEHYEASKMNYRYTLNVPEKLCNIGMTASKIQERLPNESKVFWELRKTRPYIIIVDWVSQMFLRNSPVWQLKEILLGWDEDMDKKPKILLLQGGYERWKTVYPMKCINPQFELPSNINIPSAKLDDVEYPNLEDIPMKDTSLNKSQVPQVDRSMKHGAIKAYESKKTQLQLLEENETIMNKSLQNEKELLSLEHQYKNIVTDKENNEDSATTEQIYMYKIYELEEKQAEFKAEEKTLEEQLEHSKDQITEPLEDAKVKEAERKILLIQLERKQLEEQRKKEQKSREEALKFARDRKPQFDNRMPIKTPRKNEIILSPKSLNNSVVAPEYPSFDRAEKPHRLDIDYAPIYGKVKRGLTGLKNLGNSCYQNSVIQCLSNTKPLMEYFASDIHETAINKKSKTKGLIVRALAGVVKMLWSGECQVISSRHLKMVVGEQKPEFGLSGQEDAHEFLTLMIDWLHSELQTIKVKSKAQLLEKTPKSEDAWMEHTNSTDSFVLRLFSGQTKSTVICKRCTYESTTFALSGDVQLAVPSVSSSLESCLETYFKGDDIEWKCDNCKDGRNAIKKLDYSRLPPVLIIQLKRSFYNHNSRTFGKLRTRIDYPLNNLNMLPHVCPTERKSLSSNRNHMYDLYAVVNHYGETLNQGHYTAVCRNPIQKRWYRFDDTQVTPINDCDVNSTAAFLLFYTALPDSKSS